MTTPEQPADGTRRRPRRPRTETRTAILSAAQRLFYWQGIRATGIDRVAADAEVAPVTLYRSFTTKDELVEAYVEQNAQGYEQWLRDATRPELGTAEQRLLAMFDVLAEQVRPENCRGCPFLMTLAEYPDRAHPAPARAIALKAWVRDHIRGLATELGRERRVTDPAALGDQLVLVFEGVYASVQALGADGPAR
ncbi:MAG: TetR family transcriptional regulator, partial [Gordonia sp. (in: high G+C Gram-positive bacteria)]